MNSSLTANSCKDVPEKDLLINVREPGEWQIRKLDSVFDKNPKLALFVSFFVSN